MFKINQEDIAIHKDLYDVLLDRLSDRIKFSKYQTNNYIALRNKYDRNICEIHFYKKKITIHTLTPKRKFDIGEQVPDSFGWTLNYRTNLTSIEELDDAIDIIIDSYNQM